MAVIDDEMLRIVTEEMRIGKKAKQLSEKYGIDRAVLQKLAKKTNDSKNKKKRVEEAMTCTLPESGRDYYRCYPGEWNCAICGWNAAINKMRRRDAQERYADYYCTRG